MHLLRRVARTIPLVLASLALAATCALAAHVPGVLPLASLSNHSHEQFNGVFFPPGDYTGISFAFADLSNCTFAPGTNLTGANFTGATLVNTNLGGANLAQANFRGANLTNAVLGCAQFADFRGAVLTGAIGACACQVPGSNLRDQCTVADLPSLCTAPVEFRGVISGVVFHDQNANGLLDLGEPGLPGVSVQVTDQLGPVGLITDSRGAYSFVSTAAAPASVQLGPLPAGYIASGGTFAGFHLATCRSGQGRNFAAITPATPALQSSFGRLKLLYR